MIRKTTLQAPQKVKTTPRSVPAARPSVPEPLVGWRPKSQARVASAQGPSLQPQAQHSAADLISQVNANKASAAQSTSAVTGAGLTQWATAVNAEQLRRVMPNLSPERAAAMTPHLNRAMQEAGINTPKRAAAFIAQLAHESGQLRYFEELASGRAYEGRRDLGNTQPGDGTRFKGRGPIQLTGRANYEAASRALGVDLVNNPELAARPDVGFRVAAWYWSSRGLNQLADRGDFDGITQRINGGQNGAADRRQFHQRATEVLGGGFTGGPVATSDTPTPAYDERPPQVYQTGRRGAGQPPGGAPAPDAGFTRMSNAYSTRASVSLELFLLMLQLMLESFDPESLATDPEFAEFVRASGLDWKPGTPVPQAMAAEFLAHKLASRIQAGERPEKLLGELTAASEAARAATEP
ncbi:MAG: glycoside hydrolase family 19 protein [Myxococcus sp.]|nr:glycoside hydrolase family 19 protein [Myxococcus sp.]